MNNDSPETMIVLDRAAVQQCVRELDPVAIVEQALVYQANGQTEIPPEGYLAWENSEGAYCRSLAMLGALTGPSRPVYGLKVINAAVSNPRHGIPRAGGVSFLFDPETARPQVMAEAGYLSALRTAAYTMVSLRQLGPLSFDAVSLIGCGPLAQAHLELIARYFPAVRTVHLHDLNQLTARQLGDWWSQQTSSGAAQIHPDARSAVAAAPVLITVTTSSSPYIPAGWLPSSSFAAHVSLDDLQPDVFTTAEAIFVDDYELVRDNPRRILGRLLQDGLIAAPEDAADDRPRIAGTLGDALVGRVAPVRPQSGHVVSNPFGMSILDVALLDNVRTAAERLGLGSKLNLVEGL